MKKIFWCIQQLNYKGGAEQVSINLANNLVNNFDITLISTANIVGDISYKIDPKIKIESLDVPIEVVKLDYFTKQYLDSKQIFKFSKLILRFFYHFILFKQFYRSKMSKITKGELTIASSLDCEMFAPRKGRYLIHYHFSSDNYLNSFDKIGMFFSRKPEKTIFLSKGIYEDVVKNRKHPENKTYIDNLCRFEPVENIKFYNNRIIFVGRYSEQKNPMLALKIASELYKRNIDFTFDFYGDGPFESEMKEFIKKNHLGNVHLHKPSNTIEDEYKTSDILLVSSLYEGSPLIINEAKSFSVVPVIVPYKGDKSMINNGIDGFVSASFDFIEVADILENVLKDKENLMSIKQNVFKEITKISREKILSKWIELFSEK